ncbi:MULTISPECIES: Asp23/Gls24 family envelope stress response protein [Nocardiaceae]|jgi:uncharacterized alkaline shock family protein YloU|uniref:Asp23/Gls24 family envelope stress response protein n=1 Tax=Nocardiaceae TaxID=85025 RepID=UPI000568DC5B|nr:MULTISPECIES: Asp23/Gls24 family envelope stress response protein [Rhodococcus]OZF03530.1 Asp23/Gls24 family protein [Rhodococcus sp. 15-1189-1-1a]OZF17334.1 Asp23/Gls24 family protein [Rhodococcus sp. 14-2686-1-2]OZF54874.1 Asp23/Gls24 family protein [Rhodococcus sp. 14-2470-1b]OZF54970.1 Asp23/Gls24 family protein [Rhodococcus sp. 14-2470-1b]
MGAPDVSEVIADAVTATAGVAGLHGGMFGEAATYLPGRRVSGVRIREDGSVDVHVILRQGSPIPATADAIRTAVAAVADGPVHVTVEDVIR